MGKIKFTDLAIELKIAIVISWLIAGLWAIGFFAGLIKGLIS